MNTRVYRAVGSGCAMHGWKHPLRQTFENEYARPRQRWLRTAKVEVSGVSLTTLSQLFFRAPVFGLIRQT
ncbi:hypothetical protein BDW62DRAFT_37553 [Aspergillus aurantiobrunneus]